MKMKEFIKKNKKIVAAVASVAAITVVAVGVTLALLNSKSDNLENTFDVGSVETELDEVISGMKKQPFVKNVGKSDCYVRVRVAVSPNDLGIVLDGIGGEGWIDGGDGYYYYTEPLKPGTQTTYLFDEVILPADWYGADGNILADKFVPFDIGLYHEAVQTRIYVNGTKVVDRDEIWNNYTPVDTVE